MSDHIKCSCEHCGAKYRLPAEAQGRSAKCKACGKKFEIPLPEQSLEDSVLCWLTDANAEEAVDKPRVFQAPKAAPGASRKKGGLLQLKRNDDSSAAAESGAAAQSEKR